MTWQRIFSKELLIVLSTLNDVIYGLQMDFPSSWAHEPVCIHDGLFAAQVKYCHCGLSLPSPPLYLMVIYSNNIAIYYVPYESPL